MMDQLKLSRNTMIQIENDFVGNGDWHRLKKLKKILWT